jgi:hypothetical protein
MGPQSRFFRGTSWSCDIQPLADLGIVRLFITSQFAVPRDHGFWFHDAKRLFPVHPNAREPNPETIKGRQLQSPFLVPALENEKLMAQGADFCPKC